MAPPTPSCPNCKTPIPGGAKFCMSCGLDVSDPAGGTTVAFRESRADDLQRMVAEATKGMYRIERELGRGGMAAVYLATELELHRKVALKILPPEFSFGAGLIERFQREARTAAHLDHPNIIPIHRVGTAGRLLYFAMKYVEGRSLADVLRDRKALPIPTITAVLEAVGGALAYAHSRGVVHRDIKPANILIDRQGVVLVSDFGIARAASDDTITQSGAVVGTPQYMSPEQCAGKRVGPASDQYSLGVVGFELLTGSTPFDAESAIALIQRHISDPPPKLAPLRPDAPGELIRLVERAMKKKPDERFPTMTEFTEAVELIRITGQHAPEGRAQLKALAVGDTLSGLKVVTPISGAARTRKRATALPVVAGAAALAIAGVVGLGTWQRYSRDRDRAGAAGGAPAAGAPDTQPAGRVGAPRDTVASAPGGAVTSPQTPPDTAPRVAATPPPRAEPAPTRTVTPPAPGTLVIGQVPDGAVVTVNGNAVSAGRATLPPGEHELQIRVAGYETFSQRVTITGGATRTVNPALTPLPAAPGFLTVGSVPPGALFVDDRQVSERAVRGLAVPGGRRRIRIEAAGYQPYDTLVTISPGDTLNLGLKRLAPRSSL